MTESSPDERQERRVAFENFSRLAADWDYESWEAEHLRDKAGKFSWMTHRSTAVEDRDPNAELFAEALTRLGNRRSRFPRRVAAR
jgi:hypothetical protein